MMSNDKFAAVSSGPGWMSATLPYAGGTTTMVVVVPDQGTFSTFEAGLTADELTSILGAPIVNGSVVLPRFKFSTATSLKAALSMMGMPDAFDGAADFSGIDGARDLQISDVIHQANIEVDEQGTTAAAATAVVFRDASAMIGNVLVVDRPFLFFIRHDPTGALLFAGRVTDPTK
jgi:serpin B